MSTTAVIPQDEQALAVIPPVSQIGLMPALTMQQAVERYNMLVTFTQTIMVKDQDHGIIEGVKKPCLYKAGAEKLCTLFGLSPKFELIERVEDWTGRDHNSEPFFFYFYKCILLRGGEVVGEADGSCNSWEKKYRYRGANRKCPQCGAEALIKGKPDFERDVKYKGGYFCYGKKGGCGAKFVPGDPAIEGQDTAQVPNPDIAEQVNTIQKMAQKRALVAAVLIVTNASAFYTQDVEDIKTIDADYEDVTETSEQVRDRKIAELKAKKHEPASQGPPTKPETIREMADFLNEPFAPPERKEHDMVGVINQESERLASLEQRHAAKEAEAREVLADAAKGKPAAKKAPIKGWQIDMLKRFATAKEALQGTTGDNTLYYEVLAQGGNYKHSNEIPRAEDCERVLAMLFAAHRAWKVHKANFGELKDLREKLTEEVYCDACWEAGAIAAQPLNWTDIQLLKVLEVLRSK